MWHFTLHWIKVLTNLYGANTLIQSFAGEVSELYVSDYIY